MAYDLTLSRRLLIAECLFISHSHPLLATKVFLLNPKDKREMQSIVETQYYEHGRFKVAGGVLPNAITAYRTYGDPSNPCIVFPTCYGAKMSVGSMPVS